MDTGTGIGTGSVMDISSLISLVIATAFTCGFLLLLACHGKLALGLELLKMSLAM